MLQKQISPPLPSTGGNLSRLIKNAQMQGGRNPEKKGVPARYVVAEG
jgi:hypothetical protein